MRCERRLKTLGKHIRELIPGGHPNELNVSKLNILMSIMLTNVDMLGTFAFIDDIFTPLDTSSIVFDKGSRRREPEFTKEIAKVDRL